MHPNDLLVERIQRLKAHRKMLWIVASAQGIALIVMVVVIAYQSSDREIGHKVVVKEPELPAPNVDNTKLVIKKEIWKPIAANFSESETSKQDWKCVKTSDLMLGDTYLIMQNARMAESGSIDIDRKTYVNIAIRFRKEYPTEVFFGIGWADGSASANVDDFPLMFKFDDSKPLRSIFNKGTNGSFFMAHDDVEAFLDLATSSKKCYVRFVRKDDLKMDIVLNLSGLNDLINKVGG